MFRVKLGNIQIYLVTGVLRRVKDKVSLKPPNISFTCVMKCITINHQKNLFKSKKKL